jgi:acyl-CoA synthetase (AMP-forming)/AMP-acid ligase II
MQPHPHAHPHQGKPWHWLQPPAPHHRRYREAGLWRDRTLADEARARAEKTPDRVVFPNDAAQPSYASLLQQGHALAVALHDLGLRMGDVVGFQIPNWVEAAVINLAAAIGGFVVNPIVPIYRDAEVRQMLADGGARAFFYAGAAAPGRFDYTEMVARIRPDLPQLQHAIPVRAAAANGYEALVASGLGRAGDLPRVDPDTVKLLLYTSGTTGRPKGVLHSHNTLARVQAGSYAQWHIVDGETILMPSPVTHISGYSNGLEQPFQNGTRTVLMDGWNAAAALDLIERYQVVGTVAATPFLKELADSAQARGLRLPSLRMFACGGAAVPAGLVRDANTVFAHPCAFRVFGASEAPLVTTGYPPDRFPELAAATDGEIFDYEVLLLAPDGERFAPNGEGSGEGEILVRGPAMLMGYADEAQTREAITEDGYFRTGDIGLITPEGALLITGRKKDLIIRGGENISAKEIEDVLLQHPDVLDAAVVAMPHARLGEGVCAYIVPRGAAPDTAALTAHVFQSGLARQKCPERFEFILDLPRTASGKVRKDVLRAQIRALAQAATGHVA